MGKQVTMVNRHAGECALCGQTVDAGKGVAFRPARNRFQPPAGKWQVRHHAKEWKGSPVSGGWVGGCPSSEAAPVATVEADSVAAPVALSVEVAPVAAVESVESDAAPVEVRTPLAATVDRDALADALTFTAKAVSRHPRVPVLSGVLLSTVAGTLTVATFDYDQSREVDVPADDVAPGRVLIAHRALAELVKKLPRRTRVSLTDAGATVEVVCGAVRVTVPTMPVEDYPTLPAMPATVGTVEAAALAGTVAAVAVAACTEPTLPVLNGVMVEAAAGSLTMSTTDRYRLAVRELAWSGEDFTALIPARTLAEVAKRFGKVKGARVAVGHAPGDMLSVGLTCDRYRLITRTIEGNYPPLKSVIPAASALVATATVDTAAMVAAVECAAATLDRLSPVWLTFEGDTVTVAAGGGESASVSLPVECEWSGGSLAIALNPAYLADGLKAAGTARVTMRFVGHEKPALILPTGDGGADTAAVYLMMPIRNRDGEGHAGHYTPPAGADAAPVEVKPARKPAPVKAGEKAIYAGSVVQVLAVNGRSATVRLSGGGVVKVTRAACVRDDGATVADAARAAAAPSPVAVEAAAPVPVEGGEVASVENAPAAPVEVASVAPVEVDAAPVAPVEVPAVAVETAAPVDAVEVSAVASDAAPVEGGDAAPAPTAAQARHIARRIDAPGTPVTGAAKGVHYRCHVAGWVDRDGRVTAAGYAAIGREVPAPEAVEVATPVASDAAPAPVEVPAVEAAPAAPAADGGTVEAADGHELASRAATCYRAGDYAGALAAIVEGERIAPDYLVTGASGTAYGWADMRATLPAATAAPADAAPVEVPAAATVETASDAGTVETAAPVAVETASDAAPVEVPTVEDDAAPTVPAVEVPATPVEVAPAAPAVAVPAAAPAAPVAVPLAAGIGEVHAAIMRHLSSVELAGRVKVARRAGVWCFRTTLADGSELAGRADIAADGAVTVSTDTPAAPVEAAATAAPAAVPAAAPAPVVEAAAGAGTGDLTGAGRTYGRLPAGAKPAATAKAVREALCAARIKGAAFTVYKQRADRDMTVCATVTDAATVPADLVATVDAIAASVLAAPVLVG